MARSESSAVVVGRVRDLVDSGESVVETELGVVLVRGGLPGEQVRVRAEAARQGVRHGQLVEVLTASSARVEPACAVVDRCGGCPMMRLDLTAQRELKRERVLRALRSGGFDCEVALEPVGEGLGYRRRARLAFRRTAQRCLIGYRQGSGHQLVDVDDCPVLDRALNAALGQIRGQLAGALEGSGTLTLDSDDSGRVVVQLICDQPVGPAVYRAAEALASVAPICGVSLRVGTGAPASFADAQVRARASDARPLRAPGFSQANAEVNRRLSELVVELAQPSGARVLELYAGHGNFSVELAGSAAAFWAVEGDRAAAEACRENLAARGLSHARVLAQDVATLSLRERVDVVVLDPPRAGAKPLAALVERARAQRVVYVSCHMTTLARDLKALAPLGFRAERAHALDMFPQTAHIEAIVLLKK